MGDGAGVEQREEVAVQVGLAADGWTVFVSIAPMLTPVKLPPDFLQYQGRIWVIVSGEQGSHARPMEEPNWPRALLHQCREAGVPFNLLIGMPR